MSETQDPARTSRRPCTPLALMLLAASLASAARADRVPTGADRPPQPPAAVEGGAEGTGDPGRQVEAAYHFASAKLLADSGAFDDALAAFRRALDLDDSDPYGLIELSKFHAYLAQLSRDGRKQLTNLRTAADYAARARELAPENLDVLRSFAQVHLRLVERQQLDSLPLARAAFEELRQRTEGDLQVLTSLGQIYLWERQSAEAVDVLREASRYRPNHPTIQSMLAEALLGAGEKLEAEEVLLRLVARDPTVLEERLRVAELRSERGDHRGAVAVLRGGSRDPYSSPRLGRVLARELHLAGENEEALALVDALVAEPPSGSGLRRLRVAILSALARYDDAIAALEPLVEEQEDGAGQFQDAVLLAQLLERVGRSEEAAAMLRELAALASGTDALRAQVALAGLLERDGQVDEAVDLLAAELERADSEHVAVLGRMLGQVLQRFERFDEAVATADRMFALAADAEAAERAGLYKLAVLVGAEDWERAAELAPSLLEAEQEEVRTGALVHYAEALARLDRVDEALDRLSGDREAPGSSRLLAKRIEILYANDRAGEARELLGELTASGEPDDLFFAAQVHQRAERYADAIPLLDRLLGLEPDSLQTHFFLGAAYERSGQRERAVASFKRLLELSPDHAPALNYLGYMWAERGENLKEALPLIQRAVALEPNNGAYVDSLGWAYFQLGRYEEARLHLEWAVRLIPDDPTILEHLGDLYVRLQDLERARLSYQQALDLGGDGVDEVRRKLRDLGEKGL